jgi:hypothetical protein
MFCRRKWYGGLVILFVSIAASAQDLTLDQILRKNEEALGGTEALTKIQTLQMASKTVDSNGQETPSVLYLKRPNCRWSELTINGKIRIAGRYDTTQWFSDPSMGKSIKTFNMKPDDGWLEYYLASNIHWLLHLKAGGDIIELLGKESIKGSPAYKLKIVSKENQRTTYYYIDVKTFLPAKLASKLTDGGANINIETFPGNYKKVDGIVFAFSFDQYFDGRLVRKVFSKILVNVPIDDSIFKIPTSKTLIK